MQNFLQTIQLQARIYNSEIEPEHEIEGYCSCPIHQYQYMKQKRRQVHRAWSEAVMYPNEKVYNDLPPQTPFSGNPYTNRVVSPYGYFTGNTWYAPRRPRPDYHTKFIHQTIKLNNSLNHEAQVRIDAMEPTVNIWQETNINAAMSQLSVGPGSQKVSASKDSSASSVGEKGTSNATPDSSSKDRSKFSGFRKAIGIKSSQERVVAKTEKLLNKGRGLRNDIVAEEDSRWPDSQTRSIVATYQEKVGMVGKIAHLREKQPIQYLHLLRAGYFEPIPVAWADQASNPLKFSIEASAGWRGLTPAWRGYEDTAEERLYWVLNHREGSAGMRMKPDFISEMNMARDRMSKAVDPPPDYYSATDICHVQHTSQGYSKQVMPPPFKAYDRPEVPTDDTMILLDVSGSMNFDPVRPKYVLSTHSHVFLH